MNQITRYHRFTTVPPRRPEIKVKSYYSGYHNLTLVTLTVVWGVRVCRRISVSRVRYCIDAKDNHLHPNHVYHLNPSENSPIANVAILTMTIPFPLQEALRDSITSGTFVDTKFWLFSKRTSRPGRVGQPKPLFVNGHVAKRVPRLASRALTSAVWDT